MLIDEEGFVMAEQETIGHRILKVVRRAPGCQLDELEQSLPGLTWNQIFLEVDRLSRMGQVRVMPMGNGTYSVRLSLKRKNREVFDRLCLMEGLHAMFTRDDDDR
jgi:hypothetical protein